MGLTIHWDLEAKSVKQAKKALEEVRNAVLDLGFAEAREVVHIPDTTEAEAAFNAWRLAATPEDRDRMDQQFEKDHGIGHWTWIQAGIWSESNGKHTKHKPGELVVLQLWAGPGCEATNLSLGRIGRQRKLVGQSFTKTQYADKFVKCHLLVIAALDACKKAGILKSVSDEGDFWETRELSKLTDELHCYDAFVATVGGKLAEVYGDSVVGHDGKPILRI